MKNSSESNPRQKRYEIAKDNYEKLLNDIHNLWVQCVRPHIYDDMNMENGFLNKMKNVR